MLTNLLIRAFLIKKYLKWGLIIIVIILIIGAVFGEEQTEEKAQTTEPQTEKAEVNIDYEIISQRDFNFKDDNNIKIVRYGLNVLVHEQVSTEELKEVSKEIVERFKNENEFNAVSINFYDDEEFTSGISSVPPLELLNTLQMVSGQKLILLIQGIMILWNMLGS